MTPTQAAAERRRKWRETHSIEAGWHKEDTDASILADAYLASVPADDGEPITREWMLSIGFAYFGEALMWSYTLTDSSGSEVCVMGVFDEDERDADVPRNGSWSFRQLGESSVGRFCGIVKLPQQTTRGQVRRLLAALGVGQ